MSRRIDVPTNDCPGDCHFGDQDPVVPAAPVPAPAPVNALRAFTEEQNRIYAKASKRQKRVIIAQDVLKALKAKRLVPQTGTYFDAGVSFPTQGWSSSPIRQAIETDPTGSFQDLIPQLPACTACAKGAIFVCTALRQNQVENQLLRDRTATGLFSDANLSNALQGVFSPSQLRVIENEFECKRIIKRGPYAVMGLQRFGEKRRMKEIMENIVRNKGTFKPKKALKSQQRSQRDQDNA